MDEALMRNFEAKKQIWEKPIKLSDRVTKAADIATHCKQECVQLKSLTEKLAAVLRRAATESSRLHERPTRRIIQETEQALCKALSLIKSRIKVLLKLLFPRILAAKFRKVSFRLQDSIDNVSWLLHIFNITDYRDGDYLGLVKPSIVVKEPSIVRKEPVLCRIWEQIAILLTGSAKERSSAVTYLDALASTEHLYCKLIIEEGGLSPLLNMLRHGNLEEQEIAAHAIGVLGREPECIEPMISAGVCSVLANILEVGPTTSQAAVAGAVSEFVESYPKCGDYFVQHNFVKLLVSCIDLPDNRYACISIGKILSMQSIPRALWLLAKGNSPVCHLLAESKALLHFVFLLEATVEEVQYYSAMALMEITAVAEKDDYLRESVFESNSPACQAIVRQLVTMDPWRANSKILIPCIKMIGNLARAFKAFDQTRIIDSLVKLLDREDEDTKVEVHMEALIALTKYACTKNDLHMNHSEAILSAVGAERLINLVYFGEEMVQIPALVLLSYIVLHLPPSKELAQVKVLEVLEWASMNSSMTLDEFVQELLREAKGRLELSSMIFGVVELQE